MQNFIISILLVVTACSSPPKSDEHAYQFRIQPPANSKYSYTLENTMSSNQEVNGNEQSNDQSIDIQFTATFGSNNNGQYNVDFTYKKFVYTTNVNGNKRRIDAATADNSAALEDRLFAAFNNARLSAMVDSKGELVSISVTKSWQIKCSAPCQMIRLAAARWRKLFAPTWVKTL